MPITKDFESLNTTSNNFGRRARLGAGLLDQFVILSMIDSRESPDAAIRARPYRTPVVAPLLGWTRPVLHSAGTFAGTTGENRANSHPFRSSGQNSANEGCSPIVLSIA